MDRKQRIDPTMQALALERQVTFKICHLGKMT